jgi:hypothetical protein
MNKTKARMMAEEMEEMQAEPGTRAMRKLRGADVSNEGGLGPVRDIVKGVMGGIGSVLGPVQNKMMGRTRRSDEEIDEMAREMARGGKKFKAGGKVSSASKRADGCAIKGKTRGRFV